MSDKKVLETIFGKHHKYEVCRIPGGMFEADKYSIYRDGEYYKGSYSSLADAVEEANKAARK